MSNKPEFQNPIRINRRGFLPNSQKRVALTRTDNGEKTVYVSCSYTWLMGGLLSLYFRSCWVGYTEIDGYSEYGMPCVCISMYLLSEISEKEQK